MNNIATRGVVVEIKNLMTFDSGFTKRSIIIDQAGIKDKYPNLLEIDFLKDKTELVKDILLNDVYEFKINIGSRAWENPNTKKTSYFTSANCWSFSKLNPEPVEETSAESNDLPF
tara:strand:+ start:239 stop:583 length:345 start_codon:yes stop_codon:yes gene_type:complete